MEEKHNKKRNKRTLEFVVSDKASVLIPRIDRGGSDLPRLPGIIARVSNGGEYYEIITEHGILKDCLRACDLEMYHGQLSFDYSTIINQISLREAARKTNKRDKDLKEIEISCQCNGTCTGGKCKCFISGVKCNSHCHLKSVSKCCKK
ncbi:Ribonuclease H [Brachionus plicatilis]|uniref:Ribonuclease H n=1 Tax=Brachionus plicatilis TaxID=10195 RepID=A0A3M7R7L5_BRAPC|nr:Ribonuclease H [Brachionus plicatilis]